MFIYLVGHVQHLENYYMKEWSKSTKSLKKTSEDLEMCGAKIKFNPRDVLSEDEMVVII